MLISLIPKQIGGQKYIQNSKFGGCIMKSFVNRQPLYLQDQIRNVLFMWLEEKRRKMHWN